MAGDKPENTVWHATEAQMEKSVTYTFPTEGKYVDRDIELTVLKANCLRKQTWTHACTANDANNGRLIFATVSIDDTTNYNTPWQVHYVLMVQNNVTKANSGYYDVKIGATGSQVIYYIQNNFNSSYYPIYYHNVYRPNSGYSSEGAMIGARIQSASGPLEQRTYELYVLEEVNCKMNLRDSIGLYKDLYNSTKWTYGEYNATSQGLQETGDSDTITNDHLSNYRLTVDNEIPLCHGCLFGYTPDDKAVPFSAYTSTYTSYTSSINTARAYPTHGIDWKKGIYVTYSWACRAKNTTATESIKTFISGLDFRYTDNCIASNGSANSLGLVDNKRVFVRGVIKSDGLFYITPTNVTYNNTTYKKIWTQDIPTTIETDSDGNQYHYWYIGMPYYNSSYPNSLYQINFEEYNPMYKFDGTNFIQVHPNLSVVATTGSYNDLTNKPTIPTVNNATLTIQKNGTNVTTFTANASSNATANITVPTKVSDLTNDSNFVNQTFLNNNYLPLTNGTATNLTLSGPYKDDYYASNVCRHFYSGTPTEFLIKTKIKFVGSTHMPLIRIYGYAYGLNSPIELRVGFYIYNDTLGWAGASSTGAWKPEVYLFKYTENDIGYVAIGLKGSCYFCGFQVDAQIGALGSFSNNFRIDGWTTQHNGTDTSVKLIPNVNTDKCIQVEYKTMKTDIDGNATTATTANSVAWANVSGKPTIPSAVTESTVSGWGFTKNTGTYSKPSTGIPKTDLASAVQTSLGKADTALQEHQDISGKMDKSNPAGTGTFTMGASSSPNTSAHEAAIRSYRTSGNAGGNAINGGAVGTESMALTSDSAPGYRSVALNCSTLASGTRSFATGCTNASLGGYSSTFGQFNIAKGNHQMVLGRRNVEDTENKYALIVGNGSIDTTPIYTSNAMAVDWDGNARFKGDIYVGCNSDSTGGTKVAGTVTAVKINDTTKEPINGVVDLGTISGGGGITSETDPIFSASAAAGITSDNITAWNDIVSKFTGTNPIGTILSESDTTTFAISSTQASNDTWVKKVSVTLTPGTWWIKAAAAFAGYTGTSGTTGASAGRRSIGLSNPNTTSGSITSGTRSDTYCAGGTMATIQTMYPVKVTSNTTYTINIASSTAVRVTSSRIFAVRVG